MPKEYYADKWWDSMPEKAHKAAATMGYTKETWDGDTKIPYDSKTFFECSDAEKQAAMFLGLNPIAKKLNIWWEQCDQATKDHAITLGWTKELWDDDWEIEHLPIDKVYWGDLTPQQQKAANHFGYTKATWDETWAEEDMKSTKIFVPPVKNKPDKVPAKKPVVTSTKESVETEKEDSKWSVLDSCCFAPYKVLLAPVTTVAKVVANKVK